VLYARPPVTANMFTFGKNDWCHGLTGSAWPENIPMNINAYLIFDQRGLVADAGGGCVQCVAFFYQGCNGLMLFFRRYK